MSLLFSNIFINKSFAMVFESVQFDKSTAKVIKIPIDRTFRGHIAVANQSVVSAIPAKDLVSQFVSSQPEGSELKAALSGVFFNAYFSPSKTIEFPNNCPLIQTTLVKNRKVISCGGITNAIGFTKDGRIKIDNVEFVSKVSLNDKPSILIWSVNQNNKHPDAVVVFNSYMTLPVKVQEGSIGVLTRGNKAVEMISGRAITLNEGEELYVFNQGAITSHRGWQIFPKIGDKLITELTVKTSKGDSWSDVIDAAGGGRLLVLNGKNESRNTQYNNILDGDPKQRADFNAQLTFIGTDNNNQLVFGTASSSYAKIAEYLISIGVQDAIAMDGGASSVLYTQEKNFIYPAGRNLSNMLFFSSSVVKNIAKPTPSKITLDGKMVELDAYIINQNNYIKLRDFAHILNGTDKQFNVTWDENKKSINLITNKPYEKKGGEGVKTKLVDQEYIVNISPILKDGENISLNAFTIKGNNYFKLRDLTTLFNIDISWNENTQTAELKTK